MRVIMITVFLLSMVVSAWTDRTIVTKADQIRAAHTVQMTSAADLAAK